jgi:hypothetical protein
MATRVQLLERLFGTQLTAKETLVSYVARLTELERRLRAQGEIVSESVMVYMLLKGLPVAYTSIVQLIKMKDEVKFSEAVEMLRSEEERQTTASGSSNGHSGVAHHGDAAETQLKKGCYKCGKHDHIKANCPLLKNKPWHMANTAIVESTPGEGVHHGY